MEHPLMGYEVFWGIVAMAQIAWWGICWLSSRVVLPFLVVAWVVFAGKQVVWEFQRRRPPGQ